MVDSLISTFWYISPEYSLDLHEVRYLETGDDELRQVGEAKWDEKDKLDKWLEENAFPFGYKGRLGTTYAAARFYGRGGVYCELVHDEIMQEKPRDGFRNYQRVVRIRTEPVGDIPVPLRSGLEQLGFVEKKIEECDIAKDLQKKLSRFSR